jgi:DNA-binding MarR family transcriptional regulator/predicted GNAT family acetyltransferase
MAPTTPTRVATVRAFNRFYTRRLGMLGSGLLGTTHPLPQARVLYELGQRSVTPVADLRAALELDAGYLSRLLARLEEQRLVARERSPDDARRQRVALTQAGRAAYRTLDERSSAEIATLLDGLGDEDRRRLRRAMDTVREILDGTPRPAAFALRAPGPGDFGWVVQRHGVLYAEEYGWDESMEALVARVVADYAHGHDPERERAWIAEVAGRPAGSIFCVRRDDRTAQLRLLLVDPDARGTGIGAALVDECVRFARAAGYARIVLWTNDVLAGARRIYERAGFTLVSAKPHRSFGHDLVGEDWALEL